MCHGPVRRLSKNREGHSRHVVTDDNGYVVFETELEAQKEIADYMKMRLQQFLDGERDFDDAITLEEYVVRVLVHPDATIADETGRCFGPRVE